MSRPLKISVNTPNAKKLNVYREPGSPSSVKVNRKEDSGDARDAHYSEVTELLTGAQGTLAVISALLASFSFGALTSFNHHELTTDVLSYYIPQETLVFSYYCVTSVSIAIQMFVCVCCTVIEQQGKVARGLCLARSQSQQGGYEEALRRWYSRPAFASFRTRIIFLFVISTPLFCVSLSLLSILTIPYPYDLVPTATNIALGYAVLTHTNWLMDMFREDVLGIKRLRDSAPVTFQNEIEEGQEGEGDASTETGSDGGEVDEPAAAKNTPRKSTRKVREKSVGPSARKKNQ
jgi:hypothetical protein